MSELAVLDRTGDTRLMWDKVNEKETEAARKRFQEFIGKGYAGFRVNASGSKGEQLHDFDPSAERIIMMPPMVGG